MPIRALALVLALALGISACSLGPAYRRPNIAAPPAWRTPPAAHPTGAPSEPSVWPSADWWSGFRSAELERLIAAGRRANDDLAAAVARVRQADAEVRVATAPLLPSLDAGATGARQRVISPVAGGALLYNQFTAELSAAYELDFWGKNRAARSAALATAAASRYDRETVELSVMASIADTYFAVLELRDRLHIAQDNLASAEDILQGLQTDESVGTTTALDVAQQATVVASLAAAIPPLEQQERQSTDALAVLIGATPQGFDVAANTLSSISAPPLGAGLPSELLARRPDVARAEAQLVAANADIRAARADFLPSIALTAAGGYESRDLSTLLEPGSRIYSISAGITQPIFHAGAILGQYRLSQARFDELLANYHKAVISAFGNAEDALAAVRDSAEQLAREDNAVAKARSAYELSQEQFHAGTVNILTVLNTESALFTAQDALAQVRLAHLQALVGLFNALGGGWERDEQRVAHVDR
ncbi:MAG TPA: efflux transporter outer membrane subunit [Steroidobacteraceae bacterium]|nr:efflux transporter outer membrane subunit [Steroidobacteraceae bacterium]